MANSDWSWASLGLDQEELMCVDPEAAAQALQRAINKLTDGEVAMQIQRFGLNLCSDALVLRNRLERHEMRRHFGAAAAPWDPARDELARTADSSHSTASPSSSRLSVAHSSPNRDSYPSAVASVIDSQVPLSTGQSVGRFQDPISMEAPSQTFLSQLRIEVGEPRSHEDARVRCVESRAHIDIAQRHVSIVSIAMPQPARDTREIVSQPRVQSTRYPLNISRGFQQSSFVEEDMDLTGTSHNLPTTAQGVSNIRPSSLFDRTSFLPFPVLSSQSEKRLGGEGHNVFSSVYSLPSSNTIQLPATVAVGNRPVVVNTSSVNERVNLVDVADAFIAARTTSLFDRTSFIPVSAVSLQQVDDCPVQASFPGDCSTSSTSSDQPSPSLMSQYQNAVVPPVATANQTMLLSSFRNFSTLDGCTIQASFQENCSTAFLRPGPSSPSLMSQYQSAGASANQSTSLLFDEKASSLHGCATQASFQESCSSLCPCPGEPSPSLMSQCQNTVASAVATAKPSTSLLFCRNSNSVPDCAIPASSQGDCSTFSSCSGTSSPSSMSQCQKDVDSPVVIVERTTSSHSGQLRPVNRLGIEQDSEYCADARESPGREELPQIGEINSSRFVNTPNIVAENRSVEMSDSLTIASSAEAVGVTTRIFPTSREVQAKSNKEPICVVVKNRRFSKKRNLYVAKELIRDATLGEPPPKQFRTDAVPSTAKKKKLRLWYHQEGCVYCEPLVHWQLMPMVAAAY